MLHKLEDLRKAQKNRGEESDILRWILTWNESDYNWALTNLDSNDWYYLDLFVFKALLAMSED